MIDQILAGTRAGLPVLRARRAELERAAAQAAAPACFRQALRRDAVAVIAEVKRRSPSGGSIRSDLDAVAQALAYQRHGAAAVSVLTNEPHFGGSLEDLRAVASAVSVPVLRKDFILAEEQLLEARAAGAAAVLLIVRALPGGRLRELVASARSLGLAALVEAHDASEVDRALEAGVEVLGINSRDLGTLEVDVDRAWALLARVPADRIAVAESGIASKSDVDYAAASGADAVLVGTALSRAADPGALLSELVRTPRRGR